MFQLEEFLLKSYSVIENLNKLGEYKIRFYDKY